MIGEILANLVMLCHILLVLFIVVVPFTNSTYFLTIHAIITPFIMMHWVLNNNTCALTLIEQKLREQATGIKADPNDCFTCRLINPVYDFANNYQEYSIFIYSVTTILFAISAYKLYRKYSIGEIKSFNDLMCVKNC